MRYCLLPWWTKWGSRWCTCNIWWQVHVKSTRLEHVNFIIEKCSLVLSHFCSFSLATFSSFNFSAKINFAWSWKLYPLQLKFLEAGILLVHFLSFLRLFKWVLNVVLHFPTNWSSQSAHSSRLITQVFLQVMLWKISFLWLWLGFCKGCQFVLAWTLL